MIFELYQTLMHTIIFFGALRFDSGHLDPVSVFHEALLAAVGAQGLEIQLKLLLHFLQLLCGRWVGFPYRVTLRGQRSIKRFVTHFCRKEATWNHR